MPVVCTLKNNFETTLWYYIVLPKFFYHFWKCSSYIKFWSKKCFIEKKAIPPEFRFFWVYKKNREMAVCGRSPYKYQILSLGSFSIDLRSILYKYHFFWKRFAVSGSKKSESVIFRMHGRNRKFIEFTKTCFFKIDICLCFLYVDTKYEIYLTYDVQLSFTSFIVLTHIRPTQNFKNYEFWVLDVPIGCKYFLWKK